MASILVIDDDKPSRDALRAILELADHDIIEAPDGEAGLLHYNQTPTDLVFVDMLMPEKEGMEVIRELKKDFPSVKIIAVSGSGIQYAGFND